MKQLAPCAYCGATFLSIKGRRCCSPLCARRNRPRMSPAEALARIRASKRESARRRRAKRKGDA